MKLTVLPRSPILPHREDTPDNLLILANSFERRYSGLVQKLKQQQEKYRADSVVVVRYGARSDPKVLEKADKNLKHLEESAKQVCCDKRSEPLELEPYDLFGALDTFVRLFALLPHDSAVMVDISSFTKPHVIYLLEAANSSARIGHLRLGYTRARYGRYDALSWGAEEPLILPAFGHTRSLSDKGTFLALFCGLEPERCYSVWRRFGRGEGKRLFIDSGPEDLDRCADRAMRYNSLLIDMPHSVLPAFQPEAIIDELETLYRDAVLQERHLFIAPLTTKWEAVATWEFFRRKGKMIEASIVYAAPGRFNVSGYTRELWGETLICDIPMAELRKEC